MKTLILWFTRFESNILLSHISLFHCIVCDVVLLFGPSTRLMSLGCKMSSLWVTVTVTVPTTLMSSYMLATTFRPPRVHYGRRGMRSLRPCYTMILTLLTLSARCFTCGRGTIGWWLGGGTLTSITHWTKIDTSPLTVLSWTQEIALPSPWMS